MEENWVNFACNTIRTEALSDGVFAIAMTLLVLDLRVPDHETGSLLIGLLRQWPGYVSFLASFLYIAVIWTNHHGAFRRIASIDRVLSWANMGVLLGAVLLPFPTAVLADAFRAGSIEDERTAVVLYAALAVFMSTTWIVFFWVLHRRSSTTSSRDTVSWKAQVQRPIIGILCYIVGAGLGVLIHPAIGLVVLLIPVYYAVTSEGLRRPRPVAPTGA
jgi:uncharacterized membrane protein